MYDLWQRLESYLKKHAPAALGFLNPPASDAEIREAEAALGMRFPADFAASLRIHNGQMQETGTPPHPVPFIPQEFEKDGVYRATWGELAPLDLIVERTDFFQDVIANDSQSWARGVEFDGPVRRDGNLSCLTFVDSGSGDTLALDLNPDHGGHVGQVISIIHDPSCLLVLAPSFRDWFETLLTRYETGRYAFVVEDGELECVDQLHVTADLQDDPDNDEILRFPGGS